jgi:hypothetical protein
MAATIVASSSTKVYTSTDSGANWTPNTVPPQMWSSIASSADGTKLVAAAWPGSIYTSTNSGATWTSNNLSSASWSSVASSTNGSKLLAAIYGGPIFISTNSGTTWASSTAPVTNWHAVACSADGGKLLGAVSFGGPIYISPPISAAPSLVLTRSGNDVGLLWPTNAADFTLQQNTNLTTTNWVAVTNIPIVTNAQEQVIVSATNNQNFYRLKGP